MKKYIIFAWLSILSFSPYLAALELYARSADDIKNALNKGDIKELHIDFHEEFGGIPKEIGELINLEKLKIESDDSNGSFESNEPNDWTTIMDLPIEMAKLAKLKKLTINGGDLKSIPKIIYELKNLIELDLSENFISEIPEGICELKNLIKLDLSANSMSEIPEAICGITSLKTLNVSQNNVTEISKKIGNLKNLTDLLVDNYIKQLPDELYELKNLKRLAIGSDNLSNISKKIGNLKNLTFLDLNLKYIEELPDELYELKNLKTLHIRSGNLSNISKKIGHLKNLKDLTIFNARFLEELPEEIYSLTKLRSLCLSRCNINKISEKIGVLNNLESLHLDYNPLTTLPKAIEQLRDTITFVDLRGCPIAPAGDGSTTIGRQELRQIFGDRAWLSEEQKDIVFVTKSEVYHGLKKQKLRLNLKELKKLKVPELMITTLPGETMLKGLGLIVASLNFTNPDGPGYLSYDLLAQNPMTTEGKNDDLVRQKLLPKLSGYLKTLWEIPLDEGELGGWQMYEDQKADLKKALSYIFINICGQKNAGTRAALFSQVLNGLIHCPSGQKENIDSLILTMQQGENKVSSAIEERIRSDLAFLKNELFKRAVLPGGNGQNVHILSLYFDKLRDELGLTSALPKYQDKLGTLNDPFQKSEGNALQAFFQYFNPVTVAKWLEESMAREGDLEMMDKIDKEIKILQTKLYFAESKKEGILKRNIWFNKRKKQEKVIASFIRSENNTLKRRAEVMEGELGPVNLVEMAKYEDDKNLGNEILQLNEQISNKKAMSRELKGRYSMTDLISYLSRKGLISVNKTTYEFSGWEKYFAENPSEFYINGENFPTFSKDGAKNVLISLNVLEED